MTDAFTRCNCLVACSLGATFVSNEYHGCLNYNSVNHDEYETNFHYYLIILIILNYLIYLSRILIKSI